MANTEHFSLKKWLRGAADTQMIISPTEGLISSSMVKRKMLGNACGYKNKRFISIKDKRMYL